MIEGLLEDWRDGKYIEVADTLDRMDGKYVVQFCDLLVRYEGINQLNILKKLLV